MSNVPNADEGLIPRLAGSRRLRFAAIAVAAILVLGGVAHLDEPANAEAAQPDLVKTFKYGPSNIVSGKENLFFLASPSRQNTSGRSTLDLYRNDGSKTRSLGTVGPSTIDTELAALGNMAVIRAQNGHELWASDGRHLGPVNGGPSDPSGFTQLGKYLYFSGRDAKHGRELWRTDGHQVELVSDVEPGRGSSDPSVFYRAGSRIYFAAKTRKYGQEWWWTNGGKTKLLADVAPGRASSLKFIYGNTPVQMNGWLYFAANDGVTGSELWRSDGSSAERVADLVPGPTCSCPVSPIRVGDFVYFDAAMPDGGDPDVRGLFRTSGQGYELVAEVKIGNPIWGRSYFGSFGGSIYFSGSEYPEEPTGYSSDFDFELWRSDGVTTDLVRNIWTGPVSLDGSTGWGYPDDFTRAGDHLYFAASDEDHGRELWRLDDDGIPSLVADLRSGPKDGLDNYKGHFFTQFKGALYFTATNGHGVGLWRLPNP